MENDQDYKFKSHILNINRYVVAQMLKRAGIAYEYWKNIPREFYSTAKGSNSENNGFTDSFDHVFTRVKAIESLRPIMKSILDKIVKNNNFL